MKLHSSKHMYHPHSILPKLIHRKSYIKPRYFVTSTFYSTHTGLRAFSRSVRAPAHSSFYVYICVVVLCHSNRFTVCRAAAFGNIVVVVVGTLRPSCKLQSCQWDFVAMFGRLTGWWASACALCVCVCVRTLSTNSISYFFQSDICASCDISICL